MRIVVCHTETFHLADRLLSVGLLLLLTLLFAEHMLELCRQRRQAKNSTHLLKLLDRSIVVGGHSALNLTAHSELLDHRNDDFVILILQLPHELGDLLLVSLLKLLVLILQLVVLLLKLLFLADCFVVALQDLLGAPAVESELEVPVEHLKLFQNGFVPAFQQSVPSFHFGNLCVLTDLIHSLEAYLCAKVCLVADLSAVSSDFSKRSVLLEARDQAVIQAERSRFISTVLTLADWIVLARNLLCQQHAVLIVLQLVNHSPRLLPEVYELLHELSVLSGELDRQLLSLLNDIVPCLLLRCFLESLELLVVGSLHLQL